jgi:hypothetical protein
MSNNELSLVPAVSDDEDRLSWYWWFRGRFLSDTPDSFRPTSNDPLERIAWASIKYDHLGGPNTEHVLLANVKNGFVENPNNAWDISRSAAPIMRRVFHFNNLLHFLTVLMHMAILMPLTSTYILTSSRDTITSKRSLLRFLLYRLRKRLGI